MESLYEQFAFKLRNVDYKHKRYLYERIDWNRKLVIIKGTQKTGKTTLALQYVKNNYRLDEKILYISSDNLYFSENSLTYLIEKFVSAGGLHLFIDEIHKYPEWTDEIESVLKKFEKLKVVLIGTAVLDYTENEYLLHNAAVYELKGLSFREFLLYNTGIDFGVYSLKEILFNHVDISSNISKKIDPLAYFSAYLKYGYYPFFLNHRNEFTQILSDSVFNILESDLPYALKFDFKNIHKLKKLLYGLAKTKGENPNIKKLSDEIGPTRGTILQYIDYLDKADILNTLKINGAEDSYLSKPEIIFLANTNLFYAFGLNDKNCFFGKTFFLSQFINGNKINFSQNADFIIDDKYEIIINCKLTSSHTIFDTNKKFFPTENIEIGVKNNIPLWMFGFMY